MPDQEPKFRRRPEDRPAQVLQAALEEFRKSGFAATRVDDIAKRAGLSKGTLYRYFPSKEDMLKALIETSVAPLADNVATFAETFEGDPAEAIKRLPTLALGVLSQPDLMAIPRLVIAEAGNFPDIADYYHDTVIDRIVGAISTLIHRGVEQGTFRPVNPLVAARNMVGPVFVHMLFTHVFGRTTKNAIEPEEFLAGYLDILMNGLLARPDTKKGTIQ